MKRISLPCERAALDPATAAESAPPRWGGAGVGRVLRALGAATDERLRWLANCVLAAFDDGCRATVALPGRLRDALGAADVSVAPLRLPRATRPWRRRGPRGWGDGE
jgi:hypothetical protein